jgi:hypothetical protein
VVVFVRVCECLFVCVSICLFCFLVMVVGDVLVCDGFCVLVFVCFCV